MRTCQWAVFSGFRNPGIIKILRTQAHGIHGIHGTHQKISDFKWTPAGILSPLYLYLVLLTFNSTSPSIGSPSLVNLPSLTFVWGPWANYSITPYQNVKFICSIHLCAHYKGPLTPLSLTPVTCNWVFTWVDNSAQCSLGVPLLSYWYLVPLGTVPPCIPHGCNLQQNPRPHAHHFLSSSVEPYLPSSSPNDHDHDDFNTVFFACSTMTDLDLATEAWNGTTTRYAIGVGAVILLYDCIITMDREVCIVRPFLS